jgi:hypothetical protein
MGAHEEAVNSPRRLIEKAAQKYPRLILKK